MHVRRLELVDFRSYPAVAVDFAPGASVLVGPNGIGKTNLVEALGYVATLASHRVATDAPLVRAGAATAVIRCVVVHEDRELLVELELVPGKANRARLGHSPVRRAREVAGALRMVLFAPEDIELVRGEPAARRRYLDDLLVARRPRFAGVCADYDRVLKQRNALLRTAHLARRAGTAADLSTLEAWDAHLARHGAELLAGRRELVAALAPHLAAGYDAVAGHAGGAALGYRWSLPDPPADPLADPLADPPPEPPPEPPSDSPPEPPSDPPSEQAGLLAALTDALARSRTTDVERGVTTVGPHRDELSLTLGELPAKGYASHGECWSYAVALRLAAYRLLRAEGVEPVLVLDDVFAELDTGRRDRLARSVGDATQTLVTCAVEEDVPASLRGVRYEVRQGEVRHV